MARNRKRRSDRPARRPGDGPEPELAAARARRGAGENEGAEETPSAIEHAAPDVELAEAQLAVGRPAEPVALPDEGEDEAIDAGELALADGEEQRHGPRTVAAHRPAAPTRLLHFMQGSWRELQRVQWPDRRQVMQATGVVIGFVIVAGVFLGVSDWVATKIVHFILS